MQKTTFKISKMDFPSEEQLIRMKLDGLPNIKMLEFDIASRLLHVFHTNNHDAIFKQLDELKFDTTLVSSVSIEDFKLVDNLANERKLLWQVLAINFFFFVLELLTGFISNSMVYGLALFAVGGTVILKKNIAKAAGYFQLVLSVLGFSEVIRRFFGFGDIPNFQTMIYISILALIGNATCLYLLQKSKNKDAHMQASMIFTSNDVIVNFGVIVAGGLVYFTNSKLPDLMIGTLVFILVGIGAFKILKLSK
jgi:Co/Zn/Cd efflux system component